MGQPRPLINSFLVFSNKQYIFISNQCEKYQFHPVYGAGIQTHNLTNMSPLPLPLDQGSCYNLCQMFVNDCCSLFSVPQNGQSESTKMFVMYV